MKNPIFMDTLQLQKQGSVVNLYTPPKAPPPEYGEVLAQTLIAYAQHDRAFASTLERNIALLGGEHHAAMENFFPFHQRIELLMPHNRDHARQRATWLIARIKEESLPGTHMARERLTTWASIEINAEPRALVIGEIVGIIPTIGIGQPKKPKKKLSIVVQKEALSKPRFSLMESVAQVNLEILLHALRLAKGHLRKLEPEFADWLFEDRAMRFYKASPATLATIERDLYSLSVTYATVTDRGDIVALAISPAVNESTQEAYWDIEPLDTPP